MKINKIMCIIFCLCAPVGNAIATTWYVATNGSDNATGTSWAAAKATIQAAIDLAVSSDIVLVSNGVYATGGRLVHGAMANRIAITKAITVRSVNGSAATVIRGAGPMGDNAVRCAYVGTNAVLSGFTLNQGATRSSGDLSRERSGGGAWCETSGVLSNCVLSGNLAFLYGGGSYGGALDYCLLTGNSASYGGGSSGGVLNNCTLSGNSASNGGGAYSGTLNNCALSGNSASSLGGGIYGSALNNCTLSGNSASSGGGAAGGGLTNCIVCYNDARSDENYYYSTFNYSCTTPNPGGIGNITNEPRLASASHLSADSPCVGAAAGYVTGTDIDGEAWRTPPSMGCDEVVAGSITGALIVNALSSHSNAAVGFPIRFRAAIGGRTMGSAWNFGDGIILSNKPYAAHAFSSNGVYAVLLRAFNESYPLGVAATVTVTVSAQDIHYVNIHNFMPSAPYKSWMTAATNIQDAVDAASQVGALVLVSNGVYATGGRVVYGSMTNRVAMTKPVTVRSVNGPTATVIQGAGPVGAGAVRCVYVGTNAVLSGFTLANGATRSSGDPVFEQSGGGAWCETSGALSNCILSGCSAANSGGGAYYGALNNCTLSGCSASSGGGVYYGALNNCTLSGCSASSGGGSYNGALNNCTLSGCSASSGGGGSFGGTLDHCVLTDNFASSGGGSYGGALNNCALSGNFASSGGGSYNGALNNCTLSGNSASSGGGSYNGALNNCIVFYNDVAGGSNFQNSTFNYSCTTPDPGGTGNITNDPRFVNTAGNYRLRADSPCRDKGGNAYAQGTTDLDGHPRIVNGAVDMGAYEYQILAGYWAWASVITNGLTNFDQCATGDGVPNLLKYAVGSSPTNSDQLARLTCGISNEWFWVGFHRNTNATDVTLLVEGAYALANHATWNGVATNSYGSWGAATNVAETGANNPIAATVREPVAAATNRWMRLRVTWP